MMCICDRSTAYARYAELRIASVRQWSTRAHNGIDVSVSFPLFPPLPLSSSLFLPHPPNFLPSCSASGFLGSVLRGAGPFFASERHPRPGFGTAKFWNA